MHCYVKNRNGLNGFLECEVFTKGKSKISSKTREFYLSSEHKRRGYLGEVRLQLSIL